MESPALQRRLVATAAARYRSSGRFAYHFAKGKLGGDPVFGEIHRHALVPDRARVLDLGCGQGLLGAWLLAAQECRHDDDWCPQWPDPPRDWSFHGIELMPSDVARARRALGNRARIDCGDIRTAPLGEADVVVILDVLHYMDTAGQESVLDRVRTALGSGGRLLLRVGDASAGLPFRISNWVDRSVLLARGHGWAGLHCRSVRAWSELLARFGFVTEARPMSARTPFANVLLIGRLP